MTRAAIRAFLAAGTAVALAACGGGGGADNSANGVDSNLMFEGPTNDAGALESAYNATEPLPAVNDSNTAEDLGPAGETEGGDTGGNTLDSNVAGM